MPEKKIRGIRGQQMPRCMLMLYLLGSATVSSAQSPDQGHGQVSIQGSIIDTPCAIMTADREQSIEIPVVTTGQIRHTQQGFDRPFSITLINCSFSSAGVSASDWSHFSMTFDGASGDGLFRVNGASGVGLQIRDVFGNIAVPGKPMPGGLLSPGSQRLDYILRLMGNRDRLEAGEYQATLRFKVDYF
ncbi:fimbrial protein [Enterobacter sichuanensis]|uniref:fimbrial protein n=1 Tax=Enterobacter sichuanensis TaxID=2071710 RepID=UPI00217DF056|nr:fimbrial protein [Enterobacter sichuanensis]